jgi:hypothetical protein
VAAAPFPLDDWVCGLSSEILSRLDLTDEQAAVLLALLNRTIENDRYPLSAPIGILREIRAKLPGAPAPAPPVPPPRTGRPRR